MSVRLKSVSTDCDKSYLTWGNRTRCVRNTVTAIAWVNERDECGDESAGLQACRGEARIGNEDIRSHKHLESSAYMESSINIRASACGILIEKLKILVWNSTVINWNSYLSIPYFSPDIMGRYNRHFKHYYNIRYIISFWQCSFFAK